MPQLAKHNLPTANTDEVVESIRKALRTMQAAKNVAYGDVRTSGNPPCPQRNGWQIHRNLIDEFQEGRHYK